MKYDVTYNAQEVTVTLSETIALPPIDPERLVLPKSLQSLDSLSEIGRLVRKLLGEFAESLR